MKRPTTGHRCAWIFLGAGAYALHLALGKDSSVVENVYSRGFYVGLRWLWDRSLGLSPIPLIYIFLAMILVWNIWALFRWKKSPGLPADWRPPSRLTPEEYRSDIYVTPRAESAPAKIGKGVLVVMSWAGMFVLFFYGLWGFNYDRLGLERQLRLEVAALDLATIRAEAEGTARELAVARASVPGAKRTALGDAALPRDLETAARTLVTKVLGNAGFPVPGRARVRPLWPGGLLMRLSSSGFYFPYCGEGYIAGNLTAAEKPFVTAHEMAHAYGLTDEGAANFMSFLACSSSDEPVIRYSGLLAYWEYILPEFARLSPGEAKKLAVRLPEGVRADIRTAAENWDRYRGPVRAAAQAVYERYLKSQGIKEGVRSYDRFVVLVVAWKRREVR
jgi:hypothetical protein